MHLHRLVRSCEVAATLPTEFRKTIWLQFDALRAVGTTLLTKQRKALTSVGITHLSFGMERARHSLSALLSRRQSFYAPANRFGRLFGTVVETAEPAVHRNFLRAVITLKILVMELVVK